MKLAQWTRNAALCLIITALTGYGLYTLLTYTIPMHKGDYATAVRSRVKRDSELFYKAGMDAYDASMQLEGELAKTKLNEAKKLLNLAYESLLDKQGNVPDSSRELAGRIQFGIGKCLQRLGKNDHAIKAYEDSLRLFPDHLACKFNLEMLKSPPPPSGGGGGKQGGPDGKPDGKGGTSRPQI